MNVWQTEMLWVYLNRTRLECKEIGVKCSSKIDVIWIEPDWNVKAIDSGYFDEKLLIWIEPDWNVKNIGKLTLSFLPHYLNRTRLECKGQICL